LLWRALLLPNRCRWALRWWLLGSGPTGSSLGIVLLKEVLGIKSGGLQLLHVPFVDLRHLRVSSLAPLKIDKTLAGLVLRILELGLELLQLLLLQRELLVERGKARRGQGFVHFFKLIRLSWWLRLLLQWGLGLHLR